MDETYRHRQGYLEVGTNFSNKRTKAILEGFREDRYDGAYWPKENIDLAIFLNEQAGLLGWVETDATKGFDHELYLYLFHDGKTTEIEITFEGEIIYKKYVTIDQTLSELREAGKHGQKTDFINSGN